ncbi:uncharacterized protein [Syngnathus scovelli]|uniref:uncharacterized protein n=1 Tax=Syngnathus scovelli TaxID=161590 RepID=UPI0035CC7F39
MKSSGTAAVGFLVVTVLWRLVIGGNRDVWCRWKTPCLLEANFPIGDDVVVHWERWLPSKLQVHSFYYEQDQLKGQDQHFRGRTSLFKENIPKGNASLLLTNVLVADEGTYMCYVGTLTGQWRSFIKLNVEAAVTSIRFRPNDEDQLICSSGGIFPQPELRWSTEPALPDALRNSSQVQQETQTQLYNINGSLALAGDAHPDLEYICDVSTTNSSRRITWRKTTLDVSVAETSIECAPVSHPSSLEWTFNRSNVIANRSAGHKLHIVSNWKEHVNDVSEAGALNLYHLSANQSGTYTCTLGNNTQTRVQDILLTVTGTEDVHPNAAGITLGVLGTIGSVAAVGAIYLFTRRGPNRSWCCNRDGAPVTSSPNGVILKNKEKGPSLRVKASHPTEPLAQELEKEQMTRMRLLTTSKLHSGLVAKQAFAHTSSFCSHVSWKQAPMTFGGNRNVWCRWKTPCLLEANFPIGDDVAIHWKRVSPSKLQVHSFYYEKDQLQEQDQHFRGRTSLFKENIPKGNASLLLTNVLVADEGTYMCYVGTLTRQWRSFIKLIVVAAVTSSHFRLDDEDQLICSSGGIFPQPELRWSTEPALPDALRNSSQVQQETQTQLYNINGWLALAGNAHPDLEYICDVSTSNSSQRITWRKTILDISVAETSIECAPVSHPSSLEWTFNRSNVIANRSAGHKLHIVSDWKEHVKDVSEAGALNLYHLSADQSGTYTCTLSNNTQTRLQDILLTVTGTEDANRSTSLQTSYWWIVDLVVALKVLVLAAMLVYLKMRANRSTSLQTSYWWIVGLVVALIVLELALTVLGLVAMLVYLKRRGKATKSSSRDPEEETELNSVKGVEGESEKSNQLPTRGNNGQTGPSGPPTPPLHTLNYVSIVKIQDSRFKSFLFAMFERAKQGI